ncbi:MAG: response regulator [bacterium]|nr:MAG: response regulator [bacterium]
MRKRIIIGLTIIFAVVLLGGGLVSIVMGKLYQVNRARFLIDMVDGTVNTIDVMALEAIQGMEVVRFSEPEIRDLIDKVGRIEDMMGELEKQVMSETMARQSCGVCHQEAGQLARNLQTITRNMEETFGDLTMLTSILITGSFERGMDRLIRDIGRTLSLYHAQVTDLHRILSPMIGHINEEVNGNILRIRKIHNATIILVTILVLGGIIFLVTSVTRPIRQLSRGTEAVVKGDYAYRIAMKGRDEMSVLAERFNYMAEVLSSRDRRLQQKKLELEHLNETLERKVGERTRALRDKQEELNRRYLEMEATNEELQASYVQLQSTAAELQEAQSKLQENYNILKVMNEELQRANEVKNKFLSIMSHELRTPLTVIIGYLSLVLEKDFGRPSRELRDILTVVKEQGNSQLGLIEDLLDLTRIESGEFKLNRQPITVPGLIGKALENFRPKYEEKSIEIEVSVEEDTPRVHWDFQKMLQVFQNLLDNALKFTPSGGTITLTAHAKSDFVEIRVMDNGIGIPRDSIDQIFERFYQVDSSPTRRFGGSGLGLSIVREIVLAHGGKIFVESEEGTGTTFLMLMPVGDQEKSRRDDGKGAEAATQPIRMAPKGNGERILVVDDDEAFLKMMKLILPREAYEVTATSDPAKVIQMAKTQGANLIMLDLMMPDLDGYEVCRMIRRDPGTRNIPILVVSAASGKTVLRKVHEAGADEHITKPFNQQDLLFCIDQLLRKERPGYVQGEAPGDREAEIEQQEI